MTTLPGVVTVVTPSTPAVTDPSDAIECELSDAMFSVTASGSGPFAYQWRKDGLPLSDGGGVSGSMTSTLTLSGVGVGDEGSYECVVTDFCGAMVTSSAGSLTVVTPTPPGVTDPADVTECEGSDAILSVAGSGVGPLFYEWRKDAVPLSDGGGVSGATTDTLLLSATSSDDSGGYTCAVMNLCGSMAESAEALLTVDLPLSPGAVGNTLKLAKSADSLALSWAAAANASYYEVRRCDGSDVDCVPGFGAPIGSETSTSFLETPVGPYHWYRIDAGNSCGMP